MLIFNFDVGAILLYYTFSVPKCLTFDFFDTNSNHLYYSKY
jgi:hypothetical protein